VEQYLEQCSACAWADGRTVKQPFLTSVPVLRVQTQIFISSGSAEEAGNEAQRPCSAWKGCPSFSAEPRIERVTPVSAEVEGDCGVCDAKYQPIWGIGVLRWV